MAHCILYFLSPFLYGNLSPFLYGSQSPFLYGNQCPFPYYNIQEIYALENTVFSLYTLVNMTLIFLETAIL